MSGRYEVGVSSSADLSLNGVFISLCWSLKPIIAVFCQKLKANQGGGEEGLPQPISPSISHVRPLGGWRLYSAEVCLPKQAVALTAQ